jgi:hypothetical protein
MTSPDVVAAPLHDPAAAAAAYQSRGFVVLRGFFSAETMRTLSAETQRLWEDAERICGAATCRITKRASCSLSVSIP